MTSHRFRFYRAGGVDQVQLKTGADLVALEFLDQKLWVALSCPVAGIEFDERTLSFIDADKDGRVRAPELLAAIRWASQTLKDIEDLAKPTPLPLSAIDVETDEGKLIAKTARALLKSIGKPESETISVDEAKEALDAFNQQAENGDGLLPVEAIPDENLKTVATAILSGMSEPKLDRSGHAGFDRATLDAFFSFAKAKLEWSNGALLDGRDVLGPQTLDDIGAFFAVQPKIEDFFARVRAVSFDERALAAMNREETEYLAIGEKVIDDHASEFASFPLAHVSKDAALPLGSGVNPAWLERIVTFKEKIVLPVLGPRETLSLDDYRVLKDRLAPQLVWQESKPNSPWAALAETELRSWLDNSTEEKLAHLIAADEVAADQAGAIELVEKLVRYKRDLLLLANNYVSFTGFYKPDLEAIFQIGVLYIDQRALSLVMRVNDAARHVTLGPLSATYLLYLDAKNASGQTMSIVAAVTDGDVDNLSVGRNAVFYDRRGADWDAVVTRIVENPISIRQAFWTPYKKFVRLIEDQINKRAAAAQAESDAKLTESADKVDAASKGDVKAPPPPKKLDIGVVAALGVAVGGITAALGVFVQAFLGLGMWMPLGIIGLMLVISLPSMAVAWLKLRRRNIGPLLDANGWAINVLPRVNVPLGRSLTSLARLPKGAVRDLSDPFAEKKTPWWRLSLLVVVILAGLFWYLGKLDRYLPPKFRSVEVLGEAAPAHVRPQPIEEPVAPAP